MQLYRFANHDHLGTDMPGTQAGVTTAAPPTPITAPTMSMLSRRHHNTITQAPSHPVESAPSAGTAMAQSPETTAAHSTTLIPSSSGMTKSAASTGASQASPKHTKNSSPGAGVCTSDEYPADRRACMYNNSYYAHQVSLRNSCQYGEELFTTLFTSEGPDEHMSKGCGRASEVWSDIDI